MANRPPPSNTNEIQLYLHCARCLAELPGSGESAESYSRLNVGWTAIGLQVWCRRHNANIVHIDFEGHQHPANTTRRADA